MMRAPHAISTAVRTASGEIVVKTVPFRSLLHKHKFLNAPVLRGFISLIEMMVIGAKSLQYSADMATSTEQNASGKKQKTDLSVILSTGGAVAIGIAVFFAGPLFLTSKLLPIDANVWYFNLLAGSIRAAMFLAYLIAISFLEDIRRIFQYHGAEHQSIYAFENKVELIPQNAITYTTLHPRCGTSFLMFVMITSILSFACIDSLYIMMNGTLMLGARLVLHLSLVPVVAGISYELIRLSGRYYGNKFARLFMLPGLWLQKITTKKPDPGQLEVAMAALKAALGEDLVREYNEGLIVGSMSVHEEPS